MVILLLEALTAVPASMGTGFILQQINYQMPFSPGNNRINLPDWCTPWGVLGPARCHRHSTPPARCSWRWAFRRSSWWPSSDWPPWRRWRSGHSGSHFPRKTIGTGKGFSLRKDRPTCVITSGGSLSGKLTYLTSVSDFVLDGSTAGGQHLCRDVAHSDGTDHWGNNHPAGHFRDFFPRLTVFILVFSSSRVKTGFRDFQVTARNVSYGSVDGWLPKADSWFWCRTAAEGVVVRVRVNRNSVSPGLWIKIHRPLAFIPLLQWCWIGWRKSIYESEKVQYFGAETVQSGSRKNRIFRRKSVTIAGNW